MDSRHSLTDEQWARFAGALALMKRRGPRGRDDRQFIEAIVWILRTGAPWRDLPDSLAKWSTVYQRFRRWAQAGRWEGLRCALRGRAVVGNQAYDSDAFLDFAVEQGLASVIPSRSHRRIQRSLDAGAYALRRVIERLFGRLKVFRRVATRYEKTAASYGAVVALGASLVDHCLRSLDSGSQSGWAA